MAGWLRAQDVNFISLQSAVFCSECELISENNTPGCLACGSKALLSMSRVMGGSLRGLSTANLIQDAMLDRIVRELLRGVPAPPAMIPSAMIPSAMSSGMPSESEEFPATPSRHHVRSRSRLQVVGGTESQNPHPLLESVSAFDLDLEPAISVITDRAHVMTRANGAAIALRKGEEIVCRSRAGRTAPDLGARLQTETGISGHCVRTGEILLCHDAEANPHVDIAASRRLGARSILVAPLRYFQRTLGIVEVLASDPHAFDQRDVATLQMLSGVMVAAISRVLDRYTA